MQGKLSVYKKEGTMALKHMWIVILVLGVVQIIVSIACAAANVQSPNGHKSATFAALWSMFLVILFVFLGYKIIRGGKSHPLLVGFMIGVALMLAQLCFVLMAMFFTFGAEADTNKWTTAPSDKAYGVFSLFNMIIYFVWGIILIVHRNMVMAEPVAQQQQSTYYEEEDVAKNESNPAYDGEDQYEQQQDDDDYGEEAL